MSVVTTAGLAGWQTLGWLNHYSPRVHLAACPCSAANTATIVFREDDIANLEVFVLVASVILIILRSLIICGSQPKHEHPLRIVGRLLAIINNPIVTGSIAHTIPLAIDDEQPRVLETTWSYDDSHQRMFA